MIEQWGWVILLHGGSFAAMLYSWFLHWYRRQWRGMPTFKVPDTYCPDTTVTVLVAARNEAASIQACLTALKRQSYPPHLLEVIIIDDGSEDATAERVESFYWPRLRLIRRQGGGKKAALEQGVAAAAGELILTTDADCTVPENWVWHLAAGYRQYDAAFIAAPVQFIGEQNMLQRFQSLDFLGMMLLTGAGITGQMHYLSNGANMAYPRQVFLDLGGYRGNLDQASGDDVFLAHQIARRYPGQIIFLKTPQASVQTESEPTLSGFWQQRLRWASKNNQSRDRDLLLSLAQVFLLCWFILLTLFTLPWYGLKGFLLFLILLGIKAFQDYHLLRQASTFFGRQDLMRYFGPSQVLHILYIASIGLAANVKKTYRWKGRRLR